MLNTQSGFKYCKYIYRPQSISAKNWRQLQTHSENQKCGNTQGRREGGGRGGKIPGARTD